VNGTAGLRVFVTPASAVSGGSGIAATVPSGRPSSIQFLIVVISSALSRGSSCQLKRGVQSDSSRASNGGMMPLSTASSMRPALSNAMSYVVRSNGPIPPG
jgi:hypothetical protein